MERKIVHVVGTGTIGEPLIGILCEQKSNLGIDEITFHKHSPLTSDKPKIQNLMKKEQDYQLLKIELMILKQLVWSLNLL